MKSNSQNALLVWEPTAFIYGHHLLFTQIATLLSTHFPEVRTRTPTSIEGAPPFCSFISHGHTFKILILALTF